MFCLCSCSRHEMLSLRIYDTGKDSLSRGRSAQPHHVILSTVTHPLILELTRRKDEYQIAKVTTLPITHFQLAIWLISTHTSISYNKSLPRIRPENNSTDAVTPTLSGQESAHVPSHASALKKEAFPTPLISPRTTVALCILGYQTLLHIRYLPMDIRTTTPGRHAYP